MPFEGLKKFLIKPVWLKLKKERCFVFGFFVCFVLFGVFVVVVLLCVVFVVFGRCLFVFVVFCFVYVCFCYL